MSASAPRFQPQSLLKKKFELFLRNYIPGVIVVEEASGFAVCFSRLEKKLRYYVTLMQYLDAELTGDSQLIKACWTFKQAEEAMLKDVKCIKRIMFDWKVDHTVPKENFSEEACEPLGDTDSETSEEKEVVTAPSNTKKVSSKIIPLTTHNVFVLFGKNTPYEYQGVSLSHWSKQVNEAVKCFKAQLLLCKGSSILEDIYMNQLLLAQATIKKTIEQLQKQDTVDTKIFIGCLLAYQQANPRVQVIANTVEKFKNEFFEKIDEIVVSYLKRFKMILVPYLDEKKPENDMINAKRICLKAYAASLKPQAFADAKNSIKPG